MGIPVSAPRLLDEWNPECETDEERRFLERLNERAERGDWCADCWSHTTDHVLVSKCLSNARAAVRELRVDFFGTRMVFGYDETGQFASELDPARRGVTVVTGETPERMADIAADWWEAETAAFAASPDAQPLRPAANLSSDPSVAGARDAPNEESMDVELSASGLPFGLGHVLPARLGSVVHAIGSTQHFT